MGWCGASRKTDRVQRRGGRNMAREPARRSRERDAREIVVSEFVRQEGGEWVMQTLWQQAAMSQTDRCAAFWNTPAQEDGRGSR